MAWILNFKLKSYGIDGDLLKLLINYLADCKQGFVLGPVLFLIYINDLPNGIKSIYKIFADDLSLLSKVEGKSCSALNNDLKIISNWVFNGKCF